MAKRGRKAKGKFDDLPTDFQDAVASMNEVEIRSRISEVSLNQAALEEAKAADQHLKECQEQAAMAGAVYREGGKANKLKIQFCRQVLTDRGKAAGEGPDVQ